MENYILMGVCFVTWGATACVIKVLMPSSENAFVVGSLVGVLTAAAAGGAYYTHLAACQTCM